MDPVSRWLVVTRACVQPMTLISVAIAGLLSARAPSFNGLYFGLAALGLVMAHAANNMINDLFDLDAGLDRDDYPRALYAPQPVLAGLVSKRTLVTAVLVANLVDAAIMVVLFLARGWPVIAFALGGLFISVFYVAPPLRLKAWGLGELGVFLVWGPLMIAGTYYSATGTLDWSLLWASLPYALLVTSVLMGKHIDKLPWDSRAGVGTLPVRMGEARARLINQVLMAGFYLSVIGLVLGGIFDVWVLLVAASVPLLLKAWRAHSRAKPERPPDGYPLWPLWFVAWAFVHSRRAGALLVVGLAMGNLWPAML